MKEKKIIKNNLFYIYGNFVVAKIPSISVTYSFFPFILIVAVFFHNDALDLRARGTCNTLDRYYSQIEQKAQRYKRLTGGS